MKIKEAYNKTEVMKLLGWGRKRLEKAIESNIISAPVGMISRADIERLRGRPITDDDVSKEEVSPEDKAELDDLDARKAKSVKEIEIIRKEKEAETAEIELGEIKKLRLKPDMLDLLEDCLVEDMRNIVIGRDNLNKNIRDYNERYAGLSGFKNSLDTERASLTQALRNGEAELEAKKKQGEATINQAKSMVNSMTLKITAECERMEQEANTYANKTKKEADEHKSKIEADLEKRLEEATKSLVGLEKRIVEIKENYQTQYRPLIDTLQEWDAYIRGLKNPAMYQNVLNQSWGLTNRIQNVRTSLTIWGGV